MTTAEGGVKREVIRIMKRWQVLPMKEALATLSTECRIHGYYSMPSASGYGQAGIGDFLCVIQGKYIEIETKVPVTGKLRGIQRAHGRIVSASGGQHLVVATERQLLNLDEMLKVSYEDFNQRSQTHE